MKRIIIAVTLAFSLSACDVVAEALITSAHEVVAEKHEQDKASGKVYPEKPVRDDR